MWGECLQGAGSPEPADARLLEKPRPRPGGQPSASTGHSRGRLCHIVGAHGHASLQ